MQLWCTHLPHDKDVLKGKLSLEPDEQPAETEAQRAAVLRVWWTEEIYMFQFSLVVNKKEEWVPWK